jgi:hypothetical protein
MGITTDSAGDAISIMSMYGVVSLALEPGANRRLIPAQARDLAARLQIAAEHAEVHSGEELAMPASLNRKKADHGNDLRT